MALGPTTNELVAFNRDFFTDIFPFCQSASDSESTADIEAGVQSDHVEVALKIPGEHIINVWNISNPAYHCYFKYGKNPPFLHTYMYVEKPFVDGAMEKTLAAKVDSQASTIAERFVRGDVNIQVIVEGYEAFYEILTAKIKALGHNKFQIISLLNNKPENWRAEWNVTGILIDTSRFSILDSGVYTCRYPEEEDGNRVKDFALPYAHVEDITTYRKFVIAGVHVSGCGSQYPKSGLETLAKAIDNLRDATSGRCDVIAAGDFNTPVRYAKLSVGKELGHVFEAPYPTHVNPKSQAANYDQFVVFPRRGWKLKGYQMMPLDSTSMASQQLVRSIVNSYKKKVYLEFRETLLSTQDSR